MATRMVPILRFGTVARITNPQNGNCIVVFNGNYGSGLLSAILCSTQAKDCSSTTFANGGTVDPRYGVWNGIQVVDPGTVRFEEEQFQAELDGEPAVP